MSKTEDLKLLEYITLLENPLEELYKNKKKRRKIIFI